MTRTYAILTALAALATPALASAQSADAYYHAELGSVKVPGKLVSSEVVWTGHDNVMEAPAAQDIAKRVCATLAQNVGAVSAFTAEGKALSADDMTYCNKHARKAK